MGARTVWKFRTGEDTAIHLYAHWGGSDKLRATAEAIARAKSRWSDETYATRIMISTIIGDDWLSETGYGIWAGWLDEEYFEEEYDPVTIDPTNQTVSYGAFVMPYEDFLTMAGNAMREKERV